MTRANFAVRTATVLVGLAASISLAQPEWLKRAAQDAATLSPHKDATAILLHHTADAVMSPGKTHIHFQKAALILKPSAESYGILVEALAPFREIKNLKGWTLTPEDGVRGLSKDKIARMSVSGPMDDSHVLVAKLDGVKTGAIVAFEYDVEETGITSSYQTFAFQEQQPVRFTRFSVLVPRDWALHQAEWHLRELNFVQEGARYEWGGRDLPYRAEEPLMPPWQYLARRIAVVGYDSARTSAEHFRDWPAVAKWCAEIHDPAARPAANVIAFAQSLTQDALTPKDKLEKIAGFVRDEIRYVAIEIGKSRWQPRTASETLYNRYGDCKDKTTLMRALLAAVSIPSAPVLANTDYAVRPTLPTPFQFNHCLVAIPTQDMTQLDGMSNATSNGWLFFDPTDPAARLGDLPIALQGDRVLLATQGDSLLQRLPYRAVDDYRRAYRAQARLSSAGELFAEVTITDFGERALATRYARSLTPREKQLEEWRKFFAQTMPAAAIADYQTGGQGDSAWASFRLRAQNYAKAAAPFTLLKANFFLPSQSPALTAEKREHPVWFGPALREDFEIAWTLPEGWTIEEVPTEISGAGASAALHCQIQARGNDLRVRAFQQQDGRLVPVADYALARNLSQSLSAAAKATVFLKKS